MQGLIDVRQQSLMYQPLSFIDFVRVGVRRVTFALAAVFARLQDESYQPQNSVAWIRPLQAELSDNTLALYAPNRFVLDWVRDKHSTISRITNTFLRRGCPTTAFLKWEQSPLRKR